MKSYMKDYPRTQFVRDNWEILNGVWDFAFDDQNCGEQEKWYYDFPQQLKIQVPFTYETKLSGIQNEERHDNIWYRRYWSLESFDANEQDYILHFEGSDFHTKVWVNGHFAGEHKGGYSRFSFNLTHLVQCGRNEIVVKVEDSFEIQQPRGKQRWMEQNYLCWYIQTTGIWKTVWSEIVPKIRIEHVKMTPNMQKFSLELEYDVIIPEKQLGSEYMIETEIFYKNKFINKTITAIYEKHIESSISVFSKDSFSYEASVYPWSPETPNLYDITFRIVYKGDKKDEVKSYFAMREIRIEGTNILLNGHLLYQRLILDQGYWPDSHMTPPSENALIEDIQKIKEMGYNGLRKHQKVEDERFLYWCDVMGMLVWCEAPSFYQFTDYAITEFINEWTEIVNQNYNHPSIIIWTPINESWGISCVETNIMEQYFTEAIYYLTKSMDKYRPVIVNDGWEHTISDIITLHDYEDNGTDFYQRYTRFKQEILNAEIYHGGYKSSMSNGYTYKDQPIMISEFGGIAFQNKNSGWGYGEKVKTSEEFIQRFDEITTAVKKVPYICGYCYTQVSDVQQEMNGLLDENRNYKINPQILREINERKVGYWRATLKI